MYGGYRGHTPLGPEMITGKNLCFGGGWRSQGQLLLPPPEVAQLHPPAAGHTSEGRRLHVPVLDGVCKQADARVQLLLTASAGGAEVIDANAGDFVGVKVDHLQVAQRAELCWDLP